jgi:hypothetical protein
MSAVQRAVVRKKQEVAERREAKMVEAMRAAKAIERVQAARIRHKSVHHPPGVHYIESILSLSYLVLCLLGRAGK